jgi:dipeptidyl aminopeptidase/acylaminoacyl peptidase
MPLAMLAAAAAGLAYLTWRWLRPRWEPPAFSPGRSRPRDVYFPSLDSTRLHGLYLKGKAGRPTLILCHGYSRSLAEPAEVGLSLNRAGYNVLLLDFRAAGKSGGRFTTMGYKETWDLRAAVRFLMADYGQGPIGVLGISMGAAAAVMAAAQSPEIAAVVADSPYAHLEGTMRKKLPEFARFPWLVPIGWLSVRLGEWASGLRIARVRPIDHVAAIAPRPLLLIYGERDSYIPADQPQALFERAGEPKEIWFAPGSDHAAARVDHRRQYLRRVRQFFDRYLVSGGPSP